MELQEALTKYHAASEEVKAAFKSLTIQQRRQPRGKNQKRIVAEYVAWAMQRKITLERMGMSQQEARDLADTFAPHLGRVPSRDGIEAISLRNIP